MGQKGLSFASIKKITDLDELQIIPADNSMARYKSQGHVYV